MSFALSKLLPGRKPVMKEVASAGGLLAGSFYGISPYNPDALVCEKGYEIYDRMQLDCQVSACLSIKKFAVLAKGWEIHPASDDPEDIRIADFVRFAFLDMRGSVQDVLFKVMDAIAKGFSITEMNYKYISSGPYAGMIGLESMKAKNPSEYTFDMDDFLNVRGIRSRGTGDDRLMPLEKFVVYTYMPRYEMPYGVPDLRAAYRHWWSKDIILKFFNVYLEKHGSPTIKGTYKRGLPKVQQNELLKTLEKVQQETAIVVPEEVAVELLEAQRDGERGYIEALLYHDRQIAKTILGQTLTTDEGMRTGSFALAKVHLEVLGFFLEKLRRDLEETVMREQVIRRLVDYNFNADRYPVFSLGSLQPKDLQTLGDLVTKMIQGGVVAPDEAWIREYLGLPER